VDVPQLMRAALTSGKRSAAPLSLKSYNTRNAVLSHGGAAVFVLHAFPVILGGGTTMATDEQTRLELEAAVYRRLVEHLRTRTDVQNIDLMNLAGFCRNCLSNWMKDAADQKGVAMSKDESREIVYGMPYDEWRAKYQKESSPAQKAAFEKASQKH
jgi:uncharacterized protein